MLLIYCSFTFYQKKIIFTISFLFHTCKGLIGLLSVVNTSAANSIDFYSSSSSSSSSAYFSKSEFKFEFWNLVFSSPSSSSAK